MKSALAFATVLTGLALAATAAPAHAAEPEAATVENAASTDSISQIVTAVESRYAKVQTIQAKFTQVKKDSFGKVEQTGDVVLKRPNKMRWRFTSGDEQVFVSDGSKGDCGHFLEILGPQNVVGLPDPVYPVYVDTNVMAGRTGPALDGGGYQGLRTLPATVENDFIPEPPADEVDVAYLCFPNNPTGSMIDRSRLEAWVQWANERGAIILYDAAYADFIRDPSKPRSIFEIPGARSCAVEFRSFSKHGAFTGVRCGYTVVPRDLVARTAEGDEVSPHSLWTRRWTTRANGVSWPVQRGAAALYREDGIAQTAEVVDRYMEHAGLLREGCRSLGWQVHGGEDAPFVWASSPDGSDSWTLFERILEEAAIVVTPGIGFGRMGEGFIRISAFNTRERIDEVVRRLAELAD